MNNRGAYVAFALVLAAGCGSVDAAPDAGAAGAAGDGARGGASGASGSPSVDAGAGRGGAMAAGGSAGSAGASMGSAGAGGAAHLGVCNGLPQPDDRYDGLRACPAGTTLGADDGLTLTDSMDRALYPCATCSAALCVLCRNDADGGTLTRSFWCTGPAASMAPYGTCR